MIELLVGLACYLTVFSTWPGVGAIIQPAAICVMAIAAGYALLTNRVQALRPSVAEVVIYLAGIAFVVLSMLGEADTIFLSIAFLAAVISISIICRSISLGGLLDVFARVAILEIATVIIFDHQQASIALSSGMRSGGIVRFMPLHVHPDLTGFIFGSFVILMARRAMIASSMVERVSMIVGAFVAGAFVLAASARSSVIALVAASGVAVALEYGLSRFFSNRWVRYGSILAAVLGAVFAGRIGTYFSRMLELESDSRGLASHGSGRIELWQRGVLTLLQDPKLFAFGGGFRSSNAEIIGFQTESSYLSILLDSGVFLGTAIILMFWYSPIKALRLVPPNDRHSSSLVLLASFFTFVITESVFNRYLLAIGNPTSLMSLIVLFTLSMQTNAPHREANLLNKFNGTRPLFS
jgi:exopolysaccharide production protein ExoQ